MNVKSDLIGTVYLIDDDDSMRSSLTRMLRDVGYFVYDYPSASLFLSSNKLVSPAVILLDMQMPDLSGLGLMDRLKKIGFTTLVVFLRGQSHPQEIVKGLKKGALDFLFKPINLEELLNAIRDALDYDQKQFKGILKVSEIKKNFSTLIPEKKRFVPY